ncbi:MAG: amino acid ABC transporter permease [Otoolea sp.]|nr:amino acid ABC transporter permease [Clostridiaceae bacterium]MDD6074522.1 amino acid ABC transporter permease [Clostridium sp.]MDY5483081.1 amino acid ABC transporter permease [Clostridium sp.]
MLETIIKMWSKYGYVYLNGLAGTLCLAAITVFCGTLLGTVLAVMRLSKVKPFQWVVRFYVWVLRGTPILLQLYFFWIFLPKIVHVRISDTFCIVIALIVNASSYVAEVIRAGIQAVDKGQMEAARSLGMTGRHAMTKIILPQAVKNILPALGNEFITMIKQASLASVFFINELTTSYKTVSSATFRQVESIIIAGCIYLLVTTVLGKIMEYVEWRMNRNDR